MPGGSLSIVIPVLDEARGIALALSALAPLRAEGAQIVVVDGGSADATRELAGPLCDRLVEAPRGRGAQMNAGARVASGELLVFLHADTRLPVDAARAIRDALARGDWGRFDVTIDGAHRLLALVAPLMNARPLLTGLP